MKGKTENSKIDRNLQDYKNVANLLYSKSNELYLASGHLVYVYSAHGRSLIGVIKDHECNIVNLLEISKSSTERQIITCDEGGSIFFWPNTFQSSQSKIKSDNLLGENEKDTYYMTYCNNLSGSTWVALKAQKSGGMGTLILADLHHSKSTQDLQRNIISGVNKIDVSYSGRFLAAIKEYQIYIAEFVSESSDKPLVLTKERCHRTGTLDPVCLRFHPSKDALAVGFKSGAIQLWFHILKKYPVKTTLHWHHLPVQDFRFSIDGDLFSGGGECVLVRWKLNENNKKMFLPRLGSPIVRLANDCSASYVAALHQNGAISIINSKEMQLEGIINRLSIHVPRDASQALSAGIHLHARSGNFVKNGPTGHLQFFNPASANVVYNLDITMCNFITDERNRSFPNAEVTKVCLSADGLWMATSEVCHLTPDLTEIILKFWMFSLEEQRWELNSSVQQPHSDEINAICFCDVGDDEANFVTCGDDGKFIVWDLMSYDDLGTERKHWNSAVSRDYKSWVCRACAFSADGSLLAVAFDSVVTLWNRSHYELVTVLSQSFLDNNIRNIAFGFTDSSLSTLLVRYDDYIVWWDLLSCSLLWRVYVSSSCFAIDSESGLIAVLTEGKEVLFFDGKSSKPISSETNVAPSGALCSLFSPSSGSSSKRPRILYYMDKEQNFLKIHVPNILFNDNMEMDDLGEIGESGDESNDDSLEEDSTETGIYAKLKPKSKSASKSKSAENRKPGLDKYVDDVGINSSKLLERICEVQVPNIDFMSLLDCIADTVPDRKKDTRTAEEILGISTFGSKATAKRAKADSEDDSDDESLTDEHVEAVSNLDYRKIVDLIRFE